VLNMCIVCCACNGCVVVAAMDGSCEARLLELCSELNFVHRKLKKQVYSAVQALEADLMSLNKLSRYLN